MKRFIIVLNLLILSISLFAQKGKVTQALNFKETGELDKAFESIQMAINPENEKSKKSINWPRTWGVRGEIYQAIYQTNEGNYKAISDDPLTEALFSYKKALDLDLNKKFSKSLRVKITLLINDLQNQAYEVFNDGEYDKALSSFEQILEINNLPIIQVDNLNVIDTVIIYNSGLAALSAKNFDKAIKYYKEASKYGYNGAQTFLYIASAYKQKKDTLGALESLKQGMGKYPADNDLLQNIIQTYMDMEKEKEAMGYLEIAIQQSPNNASYSCIMGSLYEKLDNEKQAVDFYEKAIEIDPKLWLAFYNLGVIYYNKGVNQFDVAGKVPTNDNAQYQIELKKADVWWEKSLPFMEKCYEMNPKDKNTIETLKTLYYRLKMNDKYNAFLEKLE